MGSALNVTLGIQALPWGQWGARAGARTGLCSLRGWPMGWMARAASQAPGFFSSAGLPPLPKPQPHRALMMSQEVGKVDNCPGAEEPHKLAPVLVFPGAPLPDPLVEERRKPPCWTVLKGRESVDRPSELRTTAVFSERGIKASWESMADCLCPGPRGRSPLSFSWDTHLHPPSQLALSPQPACNHWAGGQRDPGPNPVTLGKPPHLSRFRFLIPTPVTT